MARSISHKICGAPLARAQGAILGVGVASRCRNATVLREGNSCAGRIGAMKDRDTCSRACDWLRQIVDTIEGP